MNLGKENEGYICKEGKDAMRAMVRQTVAVVLMVLPAVTGGCASPVEVDSDGETPVLFEADFEDGSLDAWEATDGGAWRIEDGLGGKVLALFRKSNYKPKVRSPFNINLIKDVNVASFVLEVKMLSTTRDYGHRDLCLFFGHQGPSHFYYVHIANKSDPHANSIFIVDGEPRVSIAKTRTAGTKWDDKWHTVRLVRNVEKGTIEVFFDDMNEPIMTAVDKRFKWGRLGVGSFDDTGRFDNVQLWGVSN